MTSNTPKKGDIIINPNTQRPVKVGSRTWMKMVKDGLTEGRYSDPNELYQIEENQDNNEVESKIQELNKTLPYDQHSVRGRGKYKDKLVKRNKQPNPQELTQHTAKTASRIVSRNMETLSLSNSSDDIEKELERMILEEMMTGKPKKMTVKPKIPKPPTKLNKPQQQDESYYVSDDELESDNLSDNSSDN
jgi:hypothetical protein